MESCMQAAHLPCGSLERLLKVTAFTVSIYSCVYRTYVPFKSPAGETSETVAPDRGHPCHCREGQSSSGKAPAPQMP